MGEGAPRRGSGGRHPRPRPGARTVRSPRWTLGTNSSSQVGGPLARQYRTAQNIWNTWLRISGTHTAQGSSGSHRDPKEPLIRSKLQLKPLEYWRLLASHAPSGQWELNDDSTAWAIAGENSPSIKQSSARATRSCGSRSADGRTWVSVGAETKVNSVVDRLGQLLFASDV